MNSLFFHNRKLTLGLLLFAALLRPPAGRAANDPRDTWTAPGNPPAFSRTDGKTNHTNFVPNVVSYSTYNDPLIGYNRVMFAVNDRLYRYLLIPAARGYRWITPEPAERAIARVYDNLKTPGRALNHLLQLRPGAAKTNLFRLGINTSAGLLGLFDPAEAWFDLKQTETDLNDTLAEWGAGYGLYLVWPLLGPSDLRDTVSQAGGYFLDPVIYLTDNPATTAIQGFEYLQDFAPGADRYSELREQSDDPYIFFRNLYLQGVRRDAHYEQTD